MRAANEPLFKKCPTSSRSLVVFAHGFSGESVPTWGGFPDLLEGDQDLKDFDFLFWGYPTSINFLYTVARYFWADNPNIETIGEALRTLLVSQAASYERLVLVGHSMGGPRSSRSSWRNCSESGASTSTGSRRWSSTAPPAAG